MSGGIDDVFIREVRDRNNIVSVVGDYVSLRKAGNNYKGLCPFHNEKSPSFNVREDQQFYYCFGCQAGGDVISFVREMNGYAFIEAIKHLADRAGMQIPEPDPRQSGRGGIERRKPSKPRASRELKDSLYEANGIAWRFFTSTLQTMEGTGCREYLTSRGITKVGIERFGLGYAPDRWDGLVGELSEHQIDPKHAQTLSLVTAKKSGAGYFDRFRHRLMFPIRSVAGDVIAFGGRTLSTEKDVAKYVNSSDSPVYQKGEMLFGLHEARRAIRQTGYALVVEGNLDVVKASQEGLAHVIAPMGTALTPSQCRLIKRFVPRMVALYDGDRAGQAAARKAVPIAMAEDLQISIATLPEAHDPDSYIDAHGADGLKALLATAVPGWEYLCEEVISDTRARESTQGKVAALDILAPILEEIRDVRARTLYRHHLSGALGLDEASLVHLVQQTIRRKPTRRKDHTAQRRQDQGAAPTRPSAPPPQKELKLLKFMMLYPDSCASYLAHDVGALLSHSGIQDAAEAFAREWDSGEPVSPPVFVSKLKDGALGKTLLRDLATAPPTRDQWKEEFERLMFGLKHDANRRTIKALRHRYQRACITGDEAGAITLQMQMLALEKQLESLKAARR